jgi:YVTN family beta-propeller protein
LLANTVTPVDLVTGKAGAAIDVGAEPEGIAITSDGATAYVTDYGSNTITPIDIATGTTGAPIPAGTHPAGIVIEK